MQIYTLSAQLFCDYIIYFQMAKVHECVLPAACKDLCLQGGVWFFRFSKAPNLRRCYQTTQMVGKAHTVIVGFVEVSSLLVLSMVATAGKSV